MSRYVGCLTLTLMLGCGWEPPPIQDFALRVVPTEITDAIPGQRCVLLVAMEDDQAAAGSEPITITVVGEGAYAQVENDAIGTDEVAEVSVFALPRMTGDEATEGRTCSATIRARRGLVTREVTVPITITTEEDDLVAPFAHEVRDLFLPWLAEHRPELGIDSETSWAGTITTPHILVVTHYLFFSEEWEMHVFWHVMIPPYDWARIELRRRFQEETPSLAFEIPSRSAEEPSVREVEPEDHLWR